jgi:hypothetical protein
MEVSMKTKALAVLALLGLAACSDSSPTSPSEVVPDLSGNWSGNWLTQFVRPHDGYSGSWSCWGSLTLVQAPGARSFTGFAVVGAPCPAVSFDLEGTVQAGGAITFVTGGPKPGAGTCPAPPNATYSGTLSNNNRSLSARSAKSLFCPGDGEGTYDFDQIISATKNSY